MSTKTISLLQESTLTDLAFGQLLTSSNSVDQIDTHVPWEYASVYCQAVQRAWLVQPECVYVGSIPSKATPMGGWARITATKPT